MALILLLVGLLSTFVIIFQYWFNWFFFIFYYSYAIGIGKIIQNNTYDY